MLLVHVSSMTLNTSISYWVAWRCSMLSFRLFQTGATNSAVIFPQIA